MTRGAWVLLCIGLSTTASANDVCQCVAGTGVACQNAACAEGRVEGGVVQKLPDYADPPQRDGAMTPTASPDPGAPPQDAVSVPQTAGATPARIHAGTRADMALRYASAESD